VPKVVEADGVGDTRLVEEGLEGAAEDVAYGARGLQYFTYWTPNSDSTTTPQGLVFGSATLVTPGPAPYGKRRLRP
jgi:hypothetical protein